MSPKAMMQWVVGESVLNRICVLAGVAVFLATPCLAADDSIYGTTVSNVHMQVPGMTPKSAMSTLRKECRSEGLATRVAGDSLICSGYSVNYTYDLAGKTGDFNMRVAKVRRRP